MHPPLVPLNEPDRLRAIQRLEILDTDSEASFDSIVELARTLTGVPIAAFSLVDDTRQWFKSSEGLTVQQTSRDVSFCGHVVQNEALMVVPDALRDDRFSDNPLVTDGPCIRFYAGVPVYTPDRYCVGSLCVIDRIPRELSTMQLSALRQLAALIERELILRSASTIDALTELYNRGHFDQRLVDEWRRVKRDGGAFGVMMIDVDYFKRLNDSRGHQQGDLTLKRLAAVLKSCLRRPGDVLARYGGEEFVAIISQADAAAATQMAETVRAAVEAAALPHPDRPDGRDTVTVSIGVSVAAAGSGTTPEQLLKSSDTALYRAKSEGRNCVRTAAA